MKRRVTAIDGMAVRYYEAGDGPPVVLLHGAGGMARLWHRQFPPLSRHFRVIAPDLPGFGGSDFDPAIKSVRDYAGFLRRFLAALEIDRASVVGSSFGGWIACWFATLYPDMVDRLALVSPAGLYDPSHPPIPLPELLDNITALYQKNGIVSGTSEENELDKAVSTITGLADAGGFNPDLDGVMGGITAETLIVWGTDDRIIPASHARMFKDGVRDSKLLMLEGAGHMPQIEDAGTVNRVLLDFLTGSAKTSAK